MANEFPCKRYRISGKSKGSIPPLMGLIVSPEQSKMLRKVTNILRAWLPGMPLLQSPKRIVYFSLQQRKHVKEKIKDKDKRKPATRCS